MGFVVWKVIRNIDLASRYGLNCPGIESRWGQIFHTRPDRPRGPPSLLYNGYRESSRGVKRPGRGADRPTPSRAIPLLPLWNFMAYSRVNATDWVGFDASGIGLWRWVDVQLDPEKQSSATPTAEPQNPGRKLLTASLVVCWDSSFILLMQCSVTIRVKQARLRGYLTRPFWRKTASVIWLLRYSPCLSVCNNTAQRSFACACGTQIAPVTIFGYQITMNNWVLMLVYYTGGVLYSFSFFLYYSDLFLHTLVRCSVIVVPDHTQWQTHALGRIPLDEWSARRTNLYLTTHNAHDRHPWPRRHSNPQSQQASGRTPTS